MWGEAPTGFWNMGQYTNFYRIAMGEKKETDGWNNHACCVCAGTVDVVGAELMSLLNSRSTHSSSAGGPWHCLCTSGKLC